MSLGDQDDQFPFPDAELPGAAAGSRQQLVRHGEQERVLGRDVQAECRSAFLGGRCPRRAETLPGLLPVFLPDRIIRLDEPCAAGQGGPCGPRGDGLLGPPGRRAEIPAGTQGGEQLGLPRESWRL